jgi:hypothetical protein
MNATGCADEGHPVKARRHGHSVLRSRALPFKEAPAVSNAWIAGFMLVVMGVTHVPIQMQILIFIAWLAVIMSERRDK